MKKIYFTVLIVLAMFKANANGDSTKVSPFTFSGYVDTYYFVNSNQTTTNLGVSGIERVFDQKANSFELGLVQAKMTYTSSKVDGVLDLTFGNNADLGNYNNYYSPLGVKVTSTALAIKQAYMVFKATDKLSFTGGQFGTHVGYEVIDAPLNFNYSLSNLFGNGPFYHTGVKASYAFSDKMALMGGVVNGLDTKDDVNKGKGIIGQFMFKPKDSWTVYLNYFKSNEGTDTDKSIYQLFDLTSTYQVTDKFYLGLNTAYGSQTGKKWHGIAGYTNYAFTDKVSLGARYEYFDNNSGIRALRNAAGNGTTVNSLTLTGNIKLGANILFKPEIRNDSYMGGSNQFIKKDGKSVNSQTTFGAAVIFYF